MLLIQREPAVNANAENTPTYWGFLSQAMEGQKGAAHK